MLAKAVTMLTLRKCSRAREDSYHRLAPRNILSRDSGAGDLRNWTSVKGNPEMSPSG